MFPATEFRLKRLKKSSLPFQHHKAIPQIDHNTSPKTSNTTTTTKPPPLNSEITPTQSTSTNTSSSITVATTTANTATDTTNHNVSTSYTSSTANTTTTINTSTQTDTHQCLPLCSSTSPSRPGSTHPLHLLPYPCHPPSHPPPSRPPPSFPVPCRISSGYDSGGLPYHPNNNQRRSPSPGVFKDTPHPRNGRRCTLHTYTKIFVKNSSKNIKI